MLRCCEDPVVLCPGPLTSFLPGETVGYVRGRES